MDRISKTNDDSKQSFASKKNKEAIKSDPESETASFDQIHVGLVRFKSGISQKNIQTILKNKKQILLLMKSWLNKSSKVNPTKEKQLYSSIDQIEIC